MSQVQGGTIDVNVKVKVTPFVTNGEREGFEGYYVWNLQAESDLIGFVTRTPASEKWSHSRTHIDDFVTKEEASEALTNQVQFERLASYAETLLRLSTFGITDSWREDDQAGQLSHTPVRL